jgi:cytochrome c oxidase cbb3-type subunit 3
MGKKIFQQNCAVCHQDDAIGKPGLAPSLTNPEFLTDVSDTFVLTTIRDGREDTGMPPFAHLGREKIKAILAFLRSHTDRPNTAAQIDAEPPAKGDPQIGGVLFHQICSTCHGLHGDGYESGGTGTAIGKAGFLNKATDGFIRHTIKEGRSNTRMQGLSGVGGLANLSDQEVNDIIVYMRTLAKPAP